MMKITMMRDRQTYLVQVDTKRSRILDLQQHVFYPPQTTESLVRQGDWEPFTGPQSVLKEWIASCTDMKHW